MDSEVKPHYRDFFLYILIIFVACIGAVFIFSKDNLPQKTTMGNIASSSATIKTYNAKPMMVINKNKKYTSLITTSKGPMKVELFTSEVPNAVNNFVFLAREGFYNNTTFHRIVKDFMIQGGDPKGDGTGGPGYKFDDEKINRDYERGIVAMANSGPNTNGSQFFIMHKDYALPKQYVIFGQVTEGLETVDKIAEVQTTDNGRGENSKPTEKVIVEKIDISEE